MTRVRAIVLFAALAAAAPLARSAPQGSPAQPPEPPMQAPAQAPSQLDPSQMPMDMQHMMAVGPKGTLAIRAVQGTNGGPAIAGDEVELILVHRGQPVKQIKSRLDDSGIAMIGDVPVGIAVQPVVRIKHANVLYQESGPMMDAATPRASMNITVYEVTDEQPKWKVVGRQIMAARLPNEMDVVEIVTVDNLGDKTWLGMPPDDDKRRDTVVLGLPEKAEQFNLEAGFHGWCCTAYRDGSLHIQMPLMPGKMTYKFSYIVAINDGRADLRVSSPVLADQVSIVVPDDSAAVEAALVQPAGTENVQGVRVRRYNASAVPAGQQVGLLLTGLAAAAAEPASPSASDPPAAPGIPMAWTIGGSAALVVALGGVVIWRRSLRRPQLDGR